MNIDNLKIILKVAEYSSINKASLTVYKTQSQVSRIVKDFEALVNTEVFERSTKGVHPTEKGNKILDYCKEIVSLYDEMISLNEVDSVKNYHGFINIYSTVNIYSTIGEITASFSKLFPNISISYNTMQNDDVISSILQDNNGIAIFPQIYPKKDQPYYSFPCSLDFEEYYRLPVIAQCNKNSKIANKYKTLSIKALHSLPLIDFNPYPAGPSLTSTILQLMGLSSPKFQYSTDDINILYSLINNGAGIYVGMCHPSRIQNDNITILPVRSQLKVGFGSLIKNDCHSELITLFRSYLVDWYSKKY